MRIPLPVLTALAALMLPFPAGARLTRHWSDAELLEQSDLIVVGEVVSGMQALGLRSEQGAAGFKSQS